MINFIKKGLNRIGLSKRLLMAILDYSYNEIVTHIPVRFLRVAYLRIFNSNIHSSAVILMHTKILRFWRIKIDEDVVINQYCLLDCRTNKIIIGKHTDIGPYTRIWTLGHMPDSATHATSGGNVVIGHHVWISSGVTILPGLNISDGTVVASGAVVVKSTDMNDIIAGNPGVFKRKRDNQLTYRLDYNPILL